MQPLRGCFMIPSFVPHDFANATSWGFPYETPSGRTFYIIFIFLSKKNVCFKPLKNKEIGHSLKSEGMPDNRDCRI